MHRFTRKRSDSKRGPVPPVQVRYQQELREEQEPDQEITYSPLPLPLPTAVSSAAVTATGQIGSHQVRQPSPVAKEELVGIGFLPSLPPSDFRASVILPDLSRRFSLLRQSEQVTFDHLKNRFAEQRAKGVAHQISEEEEDMLLDALGRLRSRGSSTSTSQENVSTEKDQESQATSTSTSSLTSSPSSGRSKRYSNNLFGSGRLRDYTYLRSVSIRSKASSTRTTSLTPTESSVSTAVASGRVTSIAESASNLSSRSETPEGMMGSSVTSMVSLLQPGLGLQQQQQQVGETGSVVASNTTNVLSAGDGVESSTTLVPSISNAIPTASAIEYRLAKTLDPVALKRASLALQEAIRELEDETEDEIVLPRSPPIPRPVTDQMGPSSETRDSFSSFEAGVAVTADKQVNSSHDERRASPLPSRILPGYIPGMPRPMTPRDFDMDDRSHSTTPRATSPIMNAFTDSTSPSPPSGAANAASGLLRKESISAATVRQSPRPSTPLFLQRSPSVTGRQTPDAEGARKGEAIEFENPSSSTLLARRRPISPLSNLAATGITATASTGTTGNSSSSSRPGTPSNVIWQPSLSGSLGTLKGAGGGGSHVRNESWASNTSDAGSELQSAIDRHRAPQRNLRSPALPESPTVGSMNLNSLGLTGSGGTGTTPDRPPTTTNGSSAGNGGDVFSSNRSQRSPTPTQNAPRSPSSPGFGFGMDRNGSRRSSRQNAPSPWGFNNSFPALMFNTFPNSSRSSIESTGSSYHSWEGDKDKDWYEHVLGGEEPQPVWHDLSGERTDSLLSDDQAEELLRKYFGLTMADFVSIQEKLVSIANAKAASGETPRKRRPSTSQSNYAPVRVASPPPQVIQAPAPSTAVATSTPEYNKKASALLNSVVSDIQAKQPPPLDTTSPAIQKPSRGEPSPGTRRNRDLAQVLFGDDEKVVKSDKTESPPVGVPATSNSSPATNAKRTATPEPKPRPAAFTQASASPPVTQSPYQLTRNPSSARIPPTTKSEAELAREIQEKTEAATAALKNASRSHLPGDGLAHSSSISRKRIDTSQISTPRLVSASTSVDAIPLRSPSLSANNNTGTSKIGSRFKKLRGTLRAKNPLPLAEEVTPYQASTTPSQTPTSAQMANYDPAKLRVPGSPALASATEPGRFKVPVPSPPASAGPGLKGFISRFRGKQRATEASPGPETRLSPQIPSRAPPLSPLSPRHQDSSNQRTPTNDIGFNSPTPKPYNTRQAAVPPAPAAESSPTTPHAPMPSAGSHQSIMLQQLFDAANNLGLDENALNDLLVRSGSISTRNTKLARANSQATRSTSRLGQRAEAPGSIEQSNSGNSGDMSQFTIQPPGPASSRPSLSAEDGGTRPLALRSDSSRRVRDNRGDQAASTIVRRTIILPGDAKAAGIDIQSALQRTNSGKRQRRGSVNSGSIKDRAPTPPPPRSPVGQRFSNDGSPPVPSLPQSLIHPDALLGVPPSGNIEKSNSTYDSLYEMYAGESRVASAMSMDPHSTESPQTPSESGPALQFIEYANGDTIWSIVNGLRDDDNESIYTTGRASFASEYSSRDTGHDWDNMQVLVKEHARSSSKGSYSSFAFKNKKSAGAPSKSRPETKVFYSSSTQIGRLIENLSQGMDSGSFNIVPNSRPGHSASSSLSTNDINWTVEERLEHMLGSVNRSS